MKNKKIQNTCSSLYTPKVMETFKNPHNYGKIKNASGIGKVGNIVCGDVMWLYIKVDKNEKIKI
ncbi:MAG: iron-sulfur cluster assembly scaffold protein [Candidatus Staskawiczbacteria bacterium]|nr:iron-sulfur cluster assembly scaffold protein [Candidatus Staskawiczbacteria bacterium]